MTPPPKQAYKAGFYGNHIVYVLINWLDRDWVIKAPEFSDCTPDEIFTALGSAFYTGMQYVNPTVDVGLPGISGQDVEAAYAEAFNWSMPYGATHRLQTYDTIVAAALSLNTTINKLREMGQAYFRSKSLLFTWFLLRLVHFIFFSPL